MKAKLIELTNTQYVVGQQADIRYDVDFCCNVKTKEIFKSLRNVPSNPYILKITHSTEPIDKKCLSCNGTTECEQCYIKPLILSEIHELIYGYSVEKMADQYFLQEYSWTGVNDLPYKEGDVRLIKSNYIDGFKAHQELTKDKLFTIDDMRDCFENGLKGNYYSDFDNYAHSLLPKKEWNIEINEEGKMKLI